MPKVHVPVAVPAGFKFCHACHDVKPLAEFSRDKGGADGVRSYCKPCDRAKTAASYARRKLLADMERRLNAPHTVASLADTPAAQAFMDALADGAERVAANVAELTAKRPPDPARPRKAPAKPRAAPTRRAARPTPAPTYAMFGEAFGNAPMLHPTLKPNDLQTRDAVKARRKVCCNC